MADPVTNNLSLILMANGTASGSWGTILNASMITLVDAGLGNTVSVALSSSNVNLTTTQRRNLAFKLTGALSNSLNVTMPLNPNSTSAAVGGFFIFENDTTGGFAVTVKTVASGSTGVAIPQGARALLYSDGTNITFADDAQNQLQVFAGNPNGSVVGTAPTAVSRASLVVNSVTNETYMATTSGTAGSTVWSKNLPYPFPSQGYLTLNSDISNPVLVADAIAATTLYYTAFRGDQIWINNGVSFVPVTIPSGQIAIPLSASFQGANGIYDAMGFLSTTGVVRVGLSPAWSTPTAGSGSRGSGAGTPQVVRSNGIFVNGFSQTVNIGSNTFTVAANRGTYLGTIAIDGTAGQVTCHVTYGQNRKWGVWNYYNREPIYLQAGEATTSWNYSSANFRPSNNSTGNAVVALCGLPEEAISVEFVQNISGTDKGFLGIGVNSVSDASGFTPTAAFGSSATSLSSSLRARHVMAPGIGINRVTSLEKTSGSTYTFVGNSTSMVLGASWNG